MSGGPLVSPALSAAPTVPHRFEPDLGRAEAGAPLYRPRQVHGRAVAVARPGAPPVGADAVLSGDPGLAVGIVTADCCPLLLASRDGRIVAAVHAGWRGLAAGVVEAAVSALARLGAEPSGLRGAVGPAAGPCCYEVGPEVPRALGLTPARRTHLDLRALLIERLAASGVDTGAIDRLGPCTICSDRWPSYRREGPAAGRALAWIRPAGRAAP